MKRLNNAAPFDFADYERTGNNAIDLVVQCIGYNRKTKKPLAKIILSKPYYDLFRAGLRILMLRGEKPQVLGDVEELLFDGVKIERAEVTMFDNLKQIYHPLPQLN